MSSTFSFDPNSFKPVTARSLNQSKWTTILDKHLQDEVFRTSVRSLRLYDAGRYASLVSRLEGRWRAAIAEIRDAAMESPESKEESDSLFVSECEDATDDEEVTGGMMIDAAANVVRRRVEEYKSEHSEEFDQDEEAYLNHCQTLAAALVEAVHEVQHNRAGPLREALFRDPVHRIVKRGTYWMREEPKPQAEELNLEPENSNVESIMDHVDVDELLDLLESTQFELGKTKGDLQRVQLELKEEKANAKQLQAERDEWKVAHFRQAATTNRAISNVPREQWEQVMSHYNMEMEAHYIMK